MKPSFLRRLFTPATSGGEPVRADSHTIAPEAISKGARTVIATLREAGYDAYVVGGGVRDLLLGRHPKDFDIATDARPEQVHNLFARSRIIGRRFRLVHVRVGREVIEVATFRGKSRRRAAGVSIHPSGRVLRDNAYGTIESDAVRRDFTINAMFYDPHSGEVRDFAGGTADLEAGIVRLIGSPKARYREDPVRMLRAVRFAAKLDFAIDDDAQAPLVELGHLLQTVSPARLFDETVKLLHCGAAEHAFALLRTHRLLGELFPSAEEALTERPGDAAFVCAALRNTDERIRAGQPVSPSFVCAAMQWPYVRQLLDEIPAGELPPAEAMHGAAEKAMQMMQRALAVPGHHARRIQATWLLQPRLERGLGRRAANVVARPEFRSAFDFLELRVPGEPHLAEALHVWRTFQADHPAPRHRHDDEPSRPRGRRRGRRRGGRRHNRRREDT